MIAELWQEIKADLRECPEFAAIVLLAVVAGIGFNTSIFASALGDEFQVHATRGSSAIEQIEMLRTHNCSAELKPGFTVIIDLQKYNVELSVPLDGIHSFFDQVQTNLDDSFHSNERKA